MQEQYLSDNIFRKCRLEIPQTDINTITTGICMAHRQHAYQRHEMVTGSESGKCTEGACEAQWPRQLFGLCRAAQLRLGRPPLAQAWMATVRGCPACHPGEDT